MTAHVHACSPLHGLRLVCVFRSTRVHGWLQGERSRLERSRARWLILRQPMCQYYAVVCIFCCSVKSVQSRRVEHSAVQDIADDIVTPRSCFACVPWHDSTGSRSVCTSLSTEVASLCCAGVPTATAAAQDVEAPDSPRKPSLAQPSVLVVQPNGFDVACGCARLCKLWLLGCFDHRIRSRRQPAWTS